jgi:hypothetical protein
MTRRFQDLKATLKRAGNRYLDAMVYVDPSGTFYCMTSTDVAYVLPLDVPATAATTAGKEGASTPEAAVLRGRASDDTLAAVA